MRHRLAVSAAALGLLAVLSPAASAGTPPVVLDGQKVKVLKIDADAPRQANDASQATDIATGYDRYQCELPRCTSVPFVYRPAKGVKSNIMMTLTWASPTSDFDLYLMLVDKKTRTKLYSCGGSQGTSEKIFLPAGSLKTGKTYVMLVDFYRTAGEKVHAQLDMPGTDTTTHPLPANVDSQAYVNCTR